MGDELSLRRKWTFRANGEQVVFVKRSYERAAHVLMKAFIWALYLPKYPDLTVEVPIGARYKPDVVSLDRFGQPRFWGEAGHVGADKLERLVRHYRRTHLALAKWDTPLDPFAEMIQDALARIARDAPVDLLHFDSDSAERHIDERGVIHLSHDDLEWLRFS